MVIVGVGNLITMIHRPSHAATPVPNIENTAHCPFECARENIIIIVKFIKQKKWWKCSDGDEVR